VLDGYDFKKHHTLVDPSLIDKNSVVTLEKVYGLKFAETVEDKFYKTEVIPTTLEKYFTYDQKLQTLELD
jgi:hypothetical protein